jgi:hypothetical protein
MIFLDLLDFLFIVGRGGPKGEWRRFRKTAWKENP